MSRPPEVPLGTAYQLPKTGEVAAIGGVKLEVIDSEQLAAEQRKCPNLKAFASTNIAKRTMEYKEITPNTMLYCTKEENGQGVRPFVPETWRKKVMALYHDLAHCGQQGTIESIERKYFWLTLKKDVTIYVKSCIPCQSVKAHRTLRPKVDKSDIPDRRCSTLQVDIVGPLPMSRGFRYILSVIDINSGWIEVIPLAEATAYSCIQQHTAGSSGTI